MYAASGGIGVAGDNLKKNVPSFNGYFDAESHRTGGGSGGVREKY